MFLDRSSLTILGIGGAISTLAFGFSLFSAIKINPPLEYKIGKFRGKIEGVSDIEDLEFANGCKFFFYEVSTLSTNGVQSARDFKITDVDKGKMFDAAREQIKNCTKDRIIYLKLQ